MERTVVLLASPSPEFISRLTSLIKAHWDDAYQIIDLAALNASIPKSDVCIVDQDIFPESSLDFLARTSFDLAPTPMILLCNGEPEDGQAFKMVKSFTADFLIKKYLTGSLLHNTIRYAIEKEALKRDLDQQQKKYMSLFYNAVEPSFFLDKAQRITAVNEAFLKTFDMDSADVLNRPFDDFVKSANDKIMVRGVVDDLIKGVYNTRIEFGTIGLDGSFKGQLRVAPLVETSVENGQLKTEIIAYHGSLRNVILEERIRNVKKKAEQIALTYRLARTLAHEIRNPLTNINLAADQLKEDTADREDLELYFGIIERCSNRIDSILDQLLRSSEKQVVSKSTFDVIGLIQEIIDAIKDRAKLEKTKISSEITLPKAMLFGDRERLGIAFTNLLTNAIESMDKPKKVIKCHVYLDANYLCFQVSDNGMGMTEEQLNSLFDPFYTSKKSGVGLGLTSTQNIISEHNGHIDVESSLSEGSIFRIYLPLDSK